MADTWVTVIRDHYRRAWGVTPEPAALPRDGPLWELGDDFDVVMIPPNGRRPAWTTATVGMSKPDDLRAIELFMLSRSASPEVVELLVVTAHYHRTGARLGLGHTVNFGRPWLPGAAADHGLVSLPYLDGPRVGRLSAFGVEVSVCWLIPITAAEVDFKKRHGLEALEVEFERSAFDYLDPKRASVI